MHRTDDKETGDFLAGPLRAALDAAGFSSLTDLARATGYTAQYLHIARMGGRPVSARMAERLGAALGISSALVTHVLQARVRK